MSSFGALPISTFTAKPAKDFAPGSLLLARRANAVEAPTLIVAVKHVSDDGEASSYGLTLTPRFNGQLPAGELIVLGDQVSLGIEKVGAVAVDAFDTSVEAPGFNSDQHGHLGWHSTTGWRLFAIVDAHERWRAREVVVDPATWTTVPANPQAYPTLWLAVWAVQYEVGREQPVNFTITRAATAT